MFGNWLLPMATLLWQVLSRLWAGRFLQGLAGALLLGLTCAGSLAQEGSDPAGYRSAMRNVVQGGETRAGVVIHVGDSMTYANPYGQWARNGAGKSAADKEVLKWMHLGKEDDQDGWYLARFDHPDGGRSYTAASGLKAEELLRGGKQGLPALAELLKKYRPQVVVVMVGTNDAAGNVSAKDFQGSMERIAQQIIAAHAVPVLTTIPPIANKRERSDAFAQIIRDVAKQQQTPLIDLHKQILERRPKDFDGTLLAKGDVHLSANPGGVTAASEPTEANLSQCGYLLRGWLTVQKLAEVKREVLDAPRSAKVGNAFDPSNAPIAKLPEVECKDSIKLFITRDMRLSSYAGEEGLNYGGSSQLKLKSYQEMALLAFDAASLKGKEVKQATLHIRLSGKERLLRVTTSSVRAGWKEGRGNGESPTDGAATFLKQQHPQRGWGLLGGDLTAVTLGGGGSVWGSAEASLPDAKGWQAIEIAPQVMAEIVAGVSDGFLLFDDVGTEWSYLEGKYTTRPFPNRFFYSREAAADARPYVTVCLGEADTKGPPSPALPGSIDLGQVSREGEKAGSKEEARSHLQVISPSMVAIRWPIPSSQVVRQGERVSPVMAGQRGMLKYADGHAEPISADAWSLVQSRGEWLGELRLLNSQLRSEEHGALVAIEAIQMDAAGNESPKALVKVEGKLPEATAPRIRLAEIPAEANSKVAALPEWEGVQVAVVDSMDKVHPNSLKLTPPQEEKYLHRNPLWDAERKTISLSAARGEIVSAQVLLLSREGKAFPKGRLSITWKEAELKQSIQAEFFQLQTVKSSKLGEVFDPAIPLAGSPSALLPAAQGERCIPVVLELWVPPTTAAGKHEGTLQLLGENETLEIPLELNVWNFSLPDRLSFLAEMNCYGLPENEVDYYRLAHRHRTVLNRVPYSQSGQVADGCAPVVRADGTFDFSAWDKRFGPILDGSAFKDLPRAGMPVDCFYLPLHENWPATMQEHYRGSYWADAGFSQEYWKQFENASEQFTAHLQKNRYQRTLFHLFLNNKNNFKQNGWQRGSSPWLLDEPAHFQDFWALKMFGEVGLRGRNRALAGKSDPIQLLYRCDISRPQWQRDSLDEVLGYNVIAGGPFLAYREEILRRKTQFQQVIVAYGTPNHPDQSNVQGAAWCVDAWRLGADGIVPWQTIGNAQSWQQADETALLYPAKNRAASPLPVPSIRLKSYLRGEQDVEYLTLYLQAHPELSREQLAKELEQAIGLSPVREASSFQGAEDAGRITYQNLRPQTLWQLRTWLAQAISQNLPGKEDAQRGWPAGPAGR